MKNIAKDLKDNNFKPFYLLYGDEDYLLNYYKNEFKKRFVDDSNMNIAIYDKDNYIEKDFVDYLIKMPFFMDKKLVILDNIKIENEKVYDEMLKCQDINVVLLVYNGGEKVDKRTKLYNFFKDNGYICELNTQDDETISKFIKNKLTKEKKGISTKDASYLIMKAGRDLSNIMSELEKLIAYVGNRDNITKEDIDKVVHESLDDRIFAMIKYLNNNDLNNAYDIYADLTMADTTSNQSVKESIIGLLKYNYNLILSVKSLKEKGLSAADIKGTLGIQDFQLRDISEVEKSHDEKYFVDKILKLSEYNKRLRNDTIDRDVVIELLMN